MNFQRGMIMCWIIVILIIFLFGVEIFFMLYRILCMSFWRGMIMCWIIGFLVFFWLEIFFMLFRILCMRFWRGMIMCWICWCWKVFDIVLFILLGVRIFFGLYGIQFRSCWRSRGVGCYEGLVDFLFGVGFMLYVIVERNFWSRVCWDVVLMGI